MPSAAAALHSADPSKASREMRECRPAGDRIHLPQRSTHFQEVSSMSSKPVLATLLGFLAAAAVPVAAEPFSFVVVGDTTYSPPADYPLYEKLIAAINGVSPAFSIHIGDTKGRGDCGRAFQESQRPFFDHYAAPVVYTPGNNEWAECWRANRGSADPVKILAIMREVF